MPRRTRIDKRDRRRRRWTRTDQERLDRKRAEWDGAWQAPEPKKRDGK